MNTFQILAYIFELITTIAGLTGAYFILKRDRKYAGNRWMAAGVGFIAIYTLFIFLYDVFSYYWTIQIFLRIGMICVLFGGMALYFTIKVLMFSSKIFLLKRNWLPYFTIFAVYVIYLVFFTPTFIVIRSYEPVDVQINLIPLLLLIVQLLFYLGFSMYYLIFSGIKQSSGQTKKKLTIFTAGLSSTLIAIFINIASQIVSGLILGQISDVIYFAVLAVSISTMTFGFLLKKDSV
jgi:hypothetical protein